MIFPKTDVGVRKMNPFAEKTERFLKKFPTLR